MKTRRRINLFLLAALPLAFLFVPGTIRAQEGRIHFLRSVQYDFHVPERWAELRDRMPAQSTTSMVLLFDGSRSVMAPIPEEDEEQPARGGSDQPNRRALGMALRLMRQSASRSDQENMLQAYVDFESGTISETREFMGRTFLISGERPAYRWKLGTKQNEFLGYMVQKATTVHEGAEIEAWFTPQIPVPAGPGNFGGLPGLILVLSQDRGHMVFSATEIDLTGLGDDEIVPPRDGEMVTRDEYEAIVAEKLEEVRSVRGAGRRRPPFERSFR
ncbi:GLPGLI family protein [Candidatus Palauibacter sp.]|uniref:GLPGLI family protein n=1 Tax=Candidatus Palauibacter sp. TaxID=3101350 RepID=UPI003B592031